MSRGTSQAMTLSCALRSRFATLALLVALPLTAIDAQRPWRLLVLDSASGAPVRHAHLALDRRWVSRSDSAGRIRVDSLPPGTQEALVYCRPTNGVWQTLGDARRVALPSDAADTTVVRLDGGRCDPDATPRTRVTLLGVMQGEYHGTWLRACGPSERLLPADLRSAVERRGVYALALSWMPFVRFPSTEGVPADTAGGSSRRWVLVDGMLEGPGRLGHRGISTYRLEVESVRAVYATRPAGCR